VQSLSIDYLFNRVYDFLLWFKYFWNFIILRKSKEEYLNEVAHYQWEGLRDRGWLTDISNNSTSKMLPDQLNNTILTRDIDGDGIPDLSDKYQFDPTNLSPEIMKERYEATYSFWDKVKDFFGFGPIDTDKDGIPDSAEETLGLNNQNSDTDRDGVADSLEIQNGTNPHNPDSDSDGVLDGRDEYPTDGFRKTDGIDSDGDGISDKNEILLGSDRLKFDTDGDGLPDGMDTYLLDPTNTENYQQIGLELLKKDVDIIWSIQNPILALIADILSILSLFAIVLLVVAFLRWLWMMQDSARHYEHHFNHKHHHEHGAHSDISTEIPHKKDPADDYKIKELEIEEIIKTKSNFWMFQMI
jgi:hypothetical protein